MPPRNGRRRRVFGLLPPLAAVALKRSMQFSLHWMVEEEEERKGGRKGGRGGSRLEGEGGKNGQS